MNIMYVQRRAYVQSTGLHALNLVSESSSGMDALVFERFLWINRADELLSSVMKLVCVQN